MARWHALSYPLRPGSEQRVKELFRLSGRPEPEVRAEDGRIVGRLLATMAFVGRGLAVRVVEVDGPLGLVAAHLSRQDAVRELERELTAHLVVPRELADPRGAVEFFRTASMECVLARRGGGDQKVW